MSNKIKKIKTWRNTGWSVSLFDNSYIYQGNAVKGFKVLFEASYKDKAEQWQKTPFIRANRQILQQIAECLEEVNTEINNQISGTYIPENSQDIHLVTDKEIDLSAQNDEDIPF